MKKGIIIIGGGITGLTAAHHLSLEGFSVKLFEREEDVGGLCHTFQKEDFTYDYGPHHIHTTDEKILKEIKDILQEDLLHLPFHGKIYFRGKFIDYPLKGLAMFSVLPFFELVKCAWSYFCARFKRHIFKPDDRNYQEWVIGHYGKRLYDIYFGPYTQKVWGIRPNQLSNIVGKRRVPILSVRSLILNTFLGKRKRIHPEYNTQQRGYFSKGGIGTLIYRMRKRAVNDGVQIFTSNKVIGIQADNGRINVQIQKSSGEDNYEADWLISTIPLDELKNLLNQKSRIKVDSNPENLRFRSMVLLYLQLSRSRILPSPWVYFSDPRIRFNRVYEPTQIDPDVAPKGHTSLCFEITCWEGDGIWNADVDTLVGDILRWMEPEDLFHRDDVVGSFIVKISKVYPVFEKGYSQKVSSILNDLSEYGNVMPLGRMGLFQYANIDHCMRMAHTGSEALVRCANAGELLNLSRDLESFWPIKEDEFSKNR